MCRLLFCSIAVIFLNPVSDRIVGADRDQIVKLVRESNRAAVESIQSLYCKFPVPAQGVVQRVEYWRSGELIRTYWKLGDRWNDTIVSGGQIFSKSNDRDLKSNKPILLGSISRFDGMPLSANDPWARAMLVFFGDVKKPPVLVVFDDLLKLPHKILRSERVQENSKYLYLVEVEFVKQSSTIFWFDPTVNFLVKRMQVTTKEAANRTARTLTEVRKYKDDGKGVYFPEIVDNTRFVNDTSAPTETLHFSDIRINQFVDSKLFSETFPPGTEVHDLVRGKSFISEANGRRSSEEDLPNPPPPSGATFPVKSRTVTLAEPTRNFNWLLYAAAVLLTAAFLIRLIKRRYSVER